jgi:hypothetical protein
MTITDNEQGLIREYLLGRLGELECEQLEEKFVTDPEYREQVLIVEEDVLEDYLSESLTAADKAQFDSVYLATPANQQKLLVARAVERYCSVEEAAHSPPVVGDSPPAPRPQPEIASRPYRNKTIYALAAVLLVVGLAGLWALFNKWREPRGGALPQELARLNTGTGNSQAPGLSLTLPPIALRGGSELPQISSTGPEVVELLLILPADDHTNFRAVLRPGGDPESYAVENLAAGKTSSGQAISFKVPARLLSRGDHSIEVLGLNADGTAESVADYSFRVN